MFSITECKKYLSPEILEKLDEKEIVEIRDFLYALAELASEVCEMNDTSSK